MARERASTETQDERHRQGNCLLNANQSRHEAQYKRHSGSGYTPQSSALVSSSSKAQSAQRQNDNMMKCDFCQEENWTDECSKYRNIQERKKKMKGNCYKCFKSGHIFRECRSNENVCLLW